MLGWTAPTASIVPGCDCAIQQGSRPMRIIRIGLDTAKHVFQVHGVDETETAGLLGQLWRGGGAKIFAKLPPGPIGFSACRGPRPRARAFGVPWHQALRPPPP